MDAKDAMIALSALAAQAGVDVRVERFSPVLEGLARRGGVCKVAGRTVVVVDASLSDLEQAAVLGLALGSLDLGDVDVPSELISFLRTGHGPVQAGLRAKPLTRARHLFAVPKERARG